MYFDKVFYNEKYEPQTIQFICNKCGEYIQFEYTDECISNVKPEYCVVTNGSKILCKCGNRCQSGLIEPKKIIKDIHYNRQSSSNIPKCPTCSSINVQKISSLSKAGSVMLLGIFSQKVKHQFKCNNCGYEW